MEVDKAEERARVALAEVSEARAELQKLQRGVRKEEVEQAKAAVEKTAAELNYVVHGYPGRLSRFVLAVDILGDSQG